MVEPVSLTLGAVVASLLTKAAERGGATVVDATTSLGRLVWWLRDWFSRFGDTEGSTALANVEQAPDSPSRVAALASAIDRRAALDADFRDELETLVDEAKRDGVPVESIAQTAWGNQNVQIAHIAGSSINVSYGQPPPPRR